LRVRHRVGQQPQRIFLILGVLELTQQLLVHAPQRRDQRAAARAGRHACINRFDNPLPKIQPVSPCHRLPPESPPDTESPLTQRWNPSQPNSFSDSV
jgi:hypothetical protein